MKAIFASKLYIASSRKDNIRAALSDPMNKELVQQLRSYLSEDTKKELSDSPTPQESFEDHYAAPDGWDEEEAPSSGHRIDTSPRPTPSPSGGSGNLTDSWEDANDLDLPNASQDDFVDDAPEQSQVDDTSSAPEIQDNVPDETAQASTAITGVDDGQGNIPSEAELQELLKSQEQCPGVRKVSLQGDEIWIYYSDNINLNNVMEPTISALASYPNIEFNRLARTYNAVVFTVEE